MRPEGVFSSMLPLGIRWSLCGDRNRSSFWHVLQLLVNLGEEAEVNREVCRLEVVRLPVSAEHRRQLGAEALARRKTNAALHDISHKLRSKPLVGVRWLLPETIKLLGATSNFRELSEPRVEPVNAPSSIGKEDVANRADKHDA